MMNQLLPFFYFLFFTQCTTAFSQWTQKANGMHGGRVRALAASEKVIFASTSGAGVFRSSDHGVNWSPVNTGLGGRLIFSLVKKETLLFSGSYDDGVYVTADNGDSWEHRSSGLTQDKILGLCVNGEKIFAATEEGIFVSENDGASWSMSNNGLPPGHGNIPWPQINGIFSLADKLIAGLLYQGAYVSSDQGENWSAISGIPSTANVSAAAEHEGVFFVGTSRGLFASFDNGVTWHENTVPSHLEIKVIEASGGVIYIATESEVYKSDDQGSSWTQIAENGHYPDGAFAIFAADSGVFLGRANGVHYLDHNGTLSEIRNTGLTAISVESLTAQGDAIIAGTSLGLFRTKNKGDSWQPASPGDTILYSVVALGDSLTSKRDIESLYISKNNADSWSVLESPKAELYDHVTLEHDGDLYAISGAFLKVLRKGSIVWETVDLGHSQYPGYNAMTAVDDALFVSTDSDGILVSYDNGVTWKKFANPLPAWVNSIFSANGNLFALAGNTIYKAAPNATSWALVADEIQLLPLTIYSSDGFLFAGTMSGIYFSPDYGKTWINSSTDAAGTLPVLSMLAIGDDLYAGTNQCIWSRPLQSFAHEIISFFPTSGSPGTFVTIEGKNFSTDPASLVIQVNGLPAEIVSATPETISITIPQGATSGYITISINDRISSSTETLCVGGAKPTISGISTDDGFQLLSSSTFGNQWFLNGNLVAGATQQTYYPTAPGEYQVSVTENGCEGEKSTAFDVVITALETSMGNPLLKVFPIPANSTLTVEPLLFNPGAPVEITLYDLFGRCVSLHLLENPKPVSIYVGNLVKGMYLLKAAQRSNTAMLRVIKE